MGYVTYAPPKSGRCICSPRFSIVDPGQAQEGMNGVVATERFIDTAGIGFDMTVHNGFVRFANVATLPMPAQLSCRIVVFGVQYNPTSLAVEPVDHVHSLRLAKVQPHAADQAAVFVALGWVANQVCWFVDHQQAVILVDDFE